MIQWFKKLLGLEPVDITPDPMKYLIVGLGNPGSEYENTRHNIGFLVLDALAKELDVTFESDKNGHIAKGKHRGRTLFLLKPNTYMNLSGKAVRYWLQKEKINKSNLLVVVDDKNLPFGKQRIRGKGSDGGHNGLKSIEQLNDGNKYARIRIGIGAEFSKGNQVDFVLGDWTNEESDALPGIIKYSMDTAKSFAAIGLPRTMNQFNKK